MCPLRVKTARADDCSMARTWVRRTTRRPSTRSIHTPANGARRKTGIMLAKPTSPTSNALPER
jgi:hypothetical protein